MRGHRRYLWILVAVLLMTPFAYGYSSTELSLLDRGDALLASPPEGVQELRRRYGTSHHDGVCLSLVAKMLGAEQTAESLATELRGGLRPAPGRRSYLAWWHNKKMLAMELLPESASDGAAPVAEERTETQLPSAVYRMLQEHAFLPKGVRRVILWQTEPVKSRLDPRCF